jgi:hypothetical protein
MKKMLLVAFIPLVVALSSYGQESPYAEDLRFVRELRSHGYSDLAREYLNKLAPNAPPALKKELPLEKALTELEAANDEPDSAKRIALYAEAREQFKQFLQANPGHPRAAEAKLDIARATALQGKAQLNRARLESDAATRSAEGKKARDIFIDASNQLKQLPKTPERDLALALNLLDQSESYLNTGNDAETRASTQKITEALKLLDSLAAGENNSKITWEARAWAGRCLDMQDDPNGAIRKLLTVTESSGAAGRDARRLARYFLLLANKHSKGTANARLVEQARFWLRSYPNYARTPEGYGVQYYLAELLLEESENAKLPANTRKNLVSEARRYLSNVERSENEFTDRAKSLKLNAMAKQGTFRTDIKKLTTFEDCWARAQYEQLQIGEDAKKFGDNKSRADAARKEHVQHVIEALQRGLTKADAKTKEHARERSGAQALLTFYLLDQGKYKEAIAIGENFAKTETKAPQASIAAMYALVAYGQMLGERQSMATAAALKDDKEYQEDKARMLALARLMEQRWPKERAGDVARETLARQLLSEENFPEAIDKLAAISPTYPTYVSTQFLLAHAALKQADQDKAYRQRALTALKNLPAPDATASVEVNNDYVQGKLLLALELIKDKKLKDVDDLLAALAPKLASLPLDPGADKDKEKRKKFEDGLVQLTLYSTAMQADADFKAAKYAETAKRLDPLVDKFNADKLPQLKDSSVGPAIIALDLRAHVQSNNMERARVAIKALQALQGNKDDKDGDKTTAILAQLGGLITQQIEELRKKGDMASLKKAKEGFTTLLGEVIGSQKKLTPKLAHSLALCYAGMDEHKKAVELLETAVKDAAADERLQRGLQLLLVGEYLHSKDTDKASKLLDEIIKPKDGKPGWGAKNLEVQKLRVRLLEEQGKYAAAFNLSDKFVTQLVKYLNDNKLKEHYFEFYYHLVYCLLKHGQGQDDANKKAEFIRMAALRMITLEKRQNGFGSDESKKRFEELLAKEPELREQYNTLKGGK